MKLILEKVADMKIEYLEESVGKPKSYFIEGVFLQSEVVNRNRRKYPKEILEREVAKYNRNYIKENRAFGELGHPDTPSINLDRVSHVIKSLHPDGNNFIGRAKILDTPYGKIAKNFIDEGLKIGVSSRGVGSLKEQNGVNVVQDDFMIATAADIVADPSAPDAFVRGIMEGKEFYFDLKSGEWMQESAEKLRAEFRKSTVAQIEERKLTAFSKFLESL